MINNETIELIKNKLGDAVIAVEQHYDFPVYIVKKEKIHDILKTCKEDKALDFHFLTTMCGIHSPENEGAEFSHEIAYTARNPRNPVTAFEIVIDVFHITP